MPFRVQDPTPCSGKGRTGRPVLSHLCAPVPVSIIRYNVNENKRGERNYCLSPRILCEPSTQVGWVYSPPPSFSGLCWPSLQLRCPLWGPWQPCDIRVANTAPERVSDLAPRPKGKTENLQKLFGCCLPAREISVISRTLSTFS